MKTMISVLLFWATSLSFASAQQDLQLLQQNWLKTNYAADKKRQSEQFEQLIIQGEESLKRSPDSAELLIWQGIILSSAAGAQGGLAALSKVKQAKDLLEQAIEINGRALQGSAYISLGSLYYQVPAWPIAFGSDAKAKELLLRALSINPNGIDPNYFYGDYLYQQGEFKQALKVLHKALLAKPRAGRALADAARQAEVNSLLVKVQAKI